MNELCQEHFHNRALAVLYTTNSLAFTIGLLLISSNENILLSLPKDVPLLFFAGMLLTFASSGYHAIKSANKFSPMMENAKFIPLNSLPQPSKKLGPVGQLLFHFYNTIVSTYQEK